MQVEARWWLEAQNNQVDLCILERQHETLTRHATLEPDHLSSVSYSFTNS